MDIHSPADAVLRVPPGGGRIVACLAAKQAVLSPRCWRALASAR